jgi:hypothetical protein
MVIASRDAPTTARVRKGLDRRSVIMLNVLHHLPETGPSAIASNAFASNAIVTLFFGMFRRDLDALSD